MYRVNHAKKIKKKPKDQKTKDNETQNSSPTAVLHGG
jgi:hypothetical protein